MIILGQPFGFFEDVVTVCDNPLVDPAIANWIVTVITKPWTNWSLCKEVELAPIWAMHGHLKMGLTFLGASTITKRVSNQVLVQTGNERSMQCFILSESPLIFSSKQIERSTFAGFRNRLTMTSTSSLLRLGLCLLLAIGEFLLLFDNDMPSIVYLNRMKLKKDTIFHD